MTPNSLKTTRKRREKDGEERGEELRRTHNFYIALFRV